MLRMGDLLGGAFGLLRERFAAVALWGLTYLVCNAVAMFGVLPSFAGMAMNPGVPPDPAAMTARMGGIFLFDLVLGLLLLILFAASFRAVLHPEKSGFAYMRLGLDELRLLGLFLVVGLGGYILFVIGFVAIGVLVGILANWAGWGAAVTVAIILGIALVAAWIYLQVRLSLAGPLSVYRGKFVFGESFELTRGCFWPLFGSFFVVFLLVMAVQMILMSFAMVPMFGALAEAGRHPEDPGAAQAAFAQMMSQFTTVGPTTIFLAVAGAAIGTLWVALGGGVAATAARLQLGPGIGDTFD